MKPAQAKSSCAAGWRQKKAKTAGQTLVITEIPYTMIGANIGKFLSDVAALAESKKTTDIVDISNPVVQGGIRIVIELKDADVDHFISMLYKNTSGRYLWREHARNFRRTSRNARFKTDHQGKYRFPV